MTADVLAVVFTLAGLFLALPAFQLVCRALWPGLAEQSRRRFRETPGRTVLVGALAMAGFLPPVALVGVDLGPVRMLAVAWVGVGIGVALAGLQGLAVRVGGTLAAPGDRERPWRPLVKGAVALELACLVPVLGWFLLLPLLFVAGVGASVLAWVRPLRQPPLEVVPHAAGAGAAHGP